MESRASHSFSEDELNLLEQLLRKSLLGGDCRVIARAPAFRTLFAKVQAMRRALDRKTGG